MKGSFLLLMAYLHLGCGGAILNAAETPLGVNCGNSILDIGEQCDDGNTTGGDGCSAVCLVEGGYSCTDPIPANLTNQVADPGFEAGPGGGAWVEYSFYFDTPICDDSCGATGGAHAGSYWTWLGGISATVEDASVEQSVFLPSSAVELRFWLRLPECNLAADFFEVLIDDTRVFSAFGDDPRCGEAVYTEQTVDITEWADGTQHQLKFYGATNSSDENYTSFFIDDILLIHGPAAPVPSACQLLQQVIFSDGFESG